MSVVEFHWRNNGVDMRFIRVSVAACLIVSMTLVAGFIGIEDAISVAQVQIAAQTGKARAEIGADPWDEIACHSIAEINPFLSDNGDVLGYIADLSPTGYIALSADTDIRPVIAYSYTDRFRRDDAPDNILPRILRQDLHLRKLAIPYTNRKLLAENRALWNLYLSNDKSLVRSMITTETIGPWIDSNWNQGAPYNTYCPMDAGAGELSVVGCVATAMGMIVDYWEWPPSVTFHSSDSYYSNGTTPHIWINATGANIDTIDYNVVGHQPDNDTKARISYACGVATEMHYSADGSSSDTREVPDALLDHFDYEDAEGTTIMSSSFYDILEENIIETKPVELGIFGMGVGGHAIIADGLMTSGEYHLNMGWGGYENGWYFLPDGMPSGFNIIGHQAHDIIPPVVTRRAPFGLVGRADTEGSISLWWEEPLFITEDILHYNIYRKTTSSVFELVGTSDSSSFADPTVEELTYYTYGVSALYDAGESANSQFSLYSGIDDGWAHNFGGGGEQIAYAVAPTHDLGCIAVGYHKYSYLFDSDAFIIRTVPGGSIMWSAVLGGDGDDRAHGVALDSASNYVVIGETESTGDSTSDVWLIKIGDDGDTLWTRTYGTGDSDVGLSVTIAPDGGYVIAGYTGGFGVERAYFLKTDSDGILEWTHIYGNATIAKAISNVTDGGFISVGYTRDGPFGQDDFFVIRLDGSGDSLWANNCGGSFPDVGNSIIETGEGGFVLAGDSYSFGIPVFSGIHLRKLDSDGDSLWAVNYTAISDYTANSIAQYGDGNFLIAGSAEVSSNIDFFILALSDTGDSLWARLYGTLGTDIAYSAIQLADTGVVAAGVTFMDGDNDFWVMKFGGDVTTSVQENSVSTPAGINIKAFPNPFNSALTLQGPAGTEVGLFDITGAKVWEGCITQTGECTWRPDKTVGSGLYFVRVTSKTESTAKRVVFIK